MTNKKGFTLIELLIVIVIIGILAIALIPRLIGAIGKGRDAARVSDLRNIESALALYSSDKKTYPEGEGCLEATSGVGQVLVDGGYIKKSDFPVDPDSKNTVGGCTGKYYYRALTVNDIANAGALLAAHVEAKEKGNADDVPSGTDFKGIDGSLKTEGSVLVRLVN